MFNIPPSLKSTGNSVRLEAALPETRSHQLRSKASFTRNGMNSYPSYRATASRISAVRSLVWRRSSQVKSGEQQMGCPRGKERLTTCLGKNIRTLHIANVDPLPDPVSPRMLLPTFQLVAPHVRAVCPVHEVEQGGGPQTAGERYEQTARRLERASSWSGGNMVNVGFERLAKLGRYE